MTLDPAQQAAVDGRRNMVVSAGAGSGKTRVLTARYVSLIERGEASVQEILALTFTRKAAAEMFQRIFAMLRERAPDSPRARGAVDQFDEAQIATLDSFCATILRDCAARFGLPPTITTDEQELARRARRQALAFLQEVGDSPPLASFVRRSGVAGVLDNLLLPLIREHIRLSDPIDAAALIARQRTWLTQRHAAVREAVARTVAAIGELSELDTQWLDTRDAIVGAGDDPDRLRAILDTRVPGSKRGDHPELKRLWYELLTKGKSPGGLLVDLARLEETFDRIDESTAFWGQVEQLQRTVLEERRNSGVLGYREVMELAIRALIDDTELRGIYKSRFRAIMIDEFQDNNATQRDLLFLLAEAPDRCVAGIPGAADLAPDRLFFVGDQKQSIYRFRGADVSVFKRLAGEMSERVVLDRNYRSAPALVAWFNRFFSRALAGEGRDFEAEFEPALPREETPEGAPAETPPVTIAWAPPTVTLPRDPDDPWASQDFAEADWVAREIRRLIDGAEAAAVQPGEIAILFRSGGNQHIYERMLRRHGVPYRSQAIRSLFSDAPAADITALLRLIWFRDDRESYAVVLRSPFVRVGDEAFIRILQSGAEPFEPVPGLAAEDAARLAHAAGMFERLGALPDRVPHTELVRILWDEAGYRYALLARPANHPYLEHYEYLMRLARSFADLPAIELVEFLSSSLGSFEKLEDDAPAATAEAVQLSTIHGAKGLEYPIVFVVGMDSSARPREGQLLWEDPELGLTVTLPGSAAGESPLNAIAAHAREAEQARDRAEALRVLYVAATRAERRLYLTAGLRQRKSESVTADTSHFRTLAIHSGIDLEEVASATTTSEGLVRLVPIAPVRESEVRRELRTGARRPLPQAVAAFAEAEVVRREVRTTAATPSAINRGWRRLTEDHRSEAAALLPVADHDATTLGSLTHAILERAVGDGATRDAILAMPPWMAPLLPEEDAPAMVAEAWRLAEAFLGSDFGRRLLEDASRIDTELPFMIAEREEDADLVISGTIDLVVERGDRLVVVDYKTDRDLAPTQYAAQLALYREAAARLSGRAVEAGLFALRSGEWIPLSLTMAEMQQRFSLGRLAAAAVD